MPHIDPVKRKEWQQEYERNIKECIYWLEGDKCACCGATDPIYFQIDHVNNDGYIDRICQESKKKGIYKRKNGRITLKEYLENMKKYQLLCANCNQAKKLNGGKLYKSTRKDI
jgi:hypothetical protein|tara:strand:- start:535 stop:873 length:339 start_codon:yes stop_codon:yes gene_type:complete